MSKSSPGPTEVFVVEVSHEADVLKIVPGGELELIAFDRVNAGVLLQDVAVVELWPTAEGLIYTRPVLVLVHLVDCDPSLLRTHLSALQYAEPVAENRRRRPQAANTRSRAPRSQRSMPS